MTPQEAADYANGAFSPTDEGEKRIQNFIASESARNIQQFIHLLYAPGEVRYLNPARAVLSIRLAEDAAKTADKLANQTDRLVDETVKLTRFTKGLLWLTVAITFFALVQIVIAVLEYSSKTH